MFHHFVFLTLLTTVSATNGGGTCRGALQCNAEACYDCSCVSGVCSCGAGWLGDHCETPFCSNRTSGCSGHGECRQSLHNVTCTCDTYYSGDHCQIKECSLDCKHGGIPNLACDKCESCKGAWTGTLCDQWDSTVPQSRLMSQLFQISNASKKMLEDQQQFHPICAAGHECVGWGVDMFGKPTAFPVVHLTYDPSRTDKKFNGLSEPLEVVANHVVNPVWSYVDGANAFPRVGDFVQHVNTQYPGASPIPKGTSGIYSDGSASVFNEWFQKSDDRALSVVRASKSIISMSLPVDPVSKTRQYRFDRHAGDFVNSLPPAYETEDHKQQFRHFIQYYGTQYATSATMGGRVEQYSSWKTWITEAGVGDFTNSMLVRNAQIDFTKTTGITGPTSTHDEGYNKDTVVVEPMHCKGGDPTVSCQANFQQWGKTVDTSPPILLDYDLAPISDLITDPKVSLAMQAAIKDYYLEQQLAWENTNKCPVNCGPSGAGTCTWDGQTKQSSCQCTYSGLVGRQCTGCAPVTVKGTFTDVNGKVYSSSTATVGCSGQPTTVWTGQGVCRCGVGDIPSYSCDDAAATVSCARRANGNLVAYVSQGVCTATCDDAGCDEPPCCDPVQSTPCGAFEGNAGNTSPATSTASAEVSAKGQVFKYGRSQCKKVPYKKKLIPCRVRAKCEFL